MTNLLERFVDFATGEVTADVNNSSVSTDEIDTANIGGRGESNSTQTIPSNSLTTIELDTTSFEDSSIVNVDTANNQLVIQKAAVFDLTGGAKLDSCPDGTRFVVDLEINGTVVSEIDITIGGSADAAFPISDIKSLSANDTVSLALFHDSGSDQTIQAGERTSLAAVQEG